MRLKRQRRPFTPELFYIYEGEKVFQLRDSITHMVISTSPTLGGLTRNITIILNRYKHYDAYLKAVSSLSEKAVGDKQKKEREKEYKRQHKTHSKVLHNLIKEYYIENEEKEFSKKSRYKPVTTPVVENRPRLEVDNSIPSRLHKKRKSRL